MEDRRAQPRAMLDQGSGSGHEPPELERLSEALLGPIYVRLLFEDTPMAPERVGALVDDALGAQGVDTQLPVRL